jgi:hypothetical protein
MYLPAFKTSKRVEFVTVRALIKQHEPKFGLLDAQGDAQIWGHLNKYYKVNHAEHCWARGCKDADGLYLAKPG